MRFHEFANNIDMPFNLEENKLLLKIQKSKGGSINRSGLTEREIELLRLMVTKGLLERFSKNNKTYYKISKSI